MAEAHARGHGAVAITIHASLAGAAFYRALGFVEIGPEHVCLPTGDRIPCLLMRKPLSETRVAG